MKMRQGEIHLVWDGSAATPRPVAVVSATPLNRGRYVLAVPSTSAQLAERRRSPTCEPFDAGSFGLDQAPVAEADALTQLGISDLAAPFEPIGTLDDEALRLVIRAIGHAIAADCSPASA